MNNKIAIPTEGGNLCAHFGHCESFYVVVVEKDRIIKEDMIIPPAHEPGLYPAWIAELGVKTVIVMGIGEKAKALFQKENIQVIIGVRNQNLRELVKDYLGNSLVTEENSCNHKH